MPQRNLVKCIRENSSFYLFIAPFFIPFIIFWIWPLAHSFYLSLTNWSGFGDPKFIGAEFDYEEISKMRPSGLILSPGPGDPSLLDTQIDIAKHLLGQIPMMGICLGHQIIARAFGAETFKLKFGHRGGNHPVKDESSDRIYITSQNHGYAVDFNNLPSDLVVSHTNLNDGTIEGLEHKDLPIMSIQYHSEASPGPLDNEYIFNSFLEMIEDSK